SDSGSYFGLTCGVLNDRALIETLVATVGLNTHAFFPRPKHSMTLSPFQEDKESDAGPDTDMSGNEGTGPSNGE
ncbi:hypothetical protein KIPB_016756, partial [Kipferlia bialata]